MLHGEVGSTFPAVLVFAQTVIVPRAQPGGEQSTTAPSVNKRVTRVNNTSISVNNTLTSVNNTSHYVNNISLSVNKTT